MKLLPDLIFYAMAGVVLGSALYTALTRNLVRAAFSLMFTFFGMACLYLYLGADFVGIAQVIIYVGGILVLLLFGVMLTGQPTEGDTVQTRQLKGGTLVLVMLLAALAPVIFLTPWAVTDTPAAPSGESTIAPIASQLLTTYLVPFEVASLLLLVALVGAVVIARGEGKVSDERAHFAKPSDALQHHPVEDGP